MLGHGLTKRLGKNASLVASATVIAASISNVIYISDAYHPKNEPTAPRDHGTVKENNGIFKLTHSSMSSNPVVYLGRAPYICTPSGFGQKAKCLLRSSLEAHRH